MILIFNSILKFIKIIFLIILNLKIIPNYLLLFTFFYFIIDFN